MNERINNEPKARILEIQRMSTEDGPGLRTTVFFKGCSLRCTWCHNPESISLNPQLQWIDNRCIGCKTCLETCENNALTLNEAGMIIDREICLGCGQCAEECPTTALELLGSEWQVDALYKEVVKDKAYFDKSGGGITISGGEPALQPKFAAALLKRLKETGIQTAFDTCGLCSKTALEMILPYSTIVLFDLKECNPDRHKKLTGGNLDTILENLLFIRDFMKSHVHPKTLWIRTPIIPNTTDQDETIMGIGRFIAENLPKAVDRWELCAFNNLCRDKYTRLNMDWEFATANLKSEAEMNHLVSVAKKSGIDPGIVLWTGSVKIEKAEGKHEKNIV